MAEVHLKWHHTFLFLFQAILTIADTTTDILTSLEYKERGHQKWFAVSLSITLITLTVLCVWSIIATTSRAWAQDTDDVERLEPTANPDVIFRSTGINVTLSCLCMGPPLHSLQLFFFCVCRFKELWKSKNGLLVEKDRLYYLYVHTLNLKMMEGLLESAPQLIIQVYVMLHGVESGDKIALIQWISAPISFLSLVWMFTSMEFLREFANYSMKFAHGVLIFLSNAGTIAARTLAIIFFTRLFPWWVLLVFFVHWLIINLIGFWLWRSKRKQDMFIFIFAYSPFYLFVYNSYYLKKLRGSAPFTVAVQNISAISWHILFTVENIAMITAYYLASHEDDRFGVPALVIVLIGNVGGLFLKCMSWCCCFNEYSTENETFRRPMTIVLK
ncbi:XK-related protein 8-like [Orbicella faveolata]|uniref:XK-related protein 8-like n=1 Tax=Orbicella faveolata TaxID=48498 RepID=UPI0009E1EAA5|nr:XK-related protein 8-like [Orbicella faveolata]